MVHPYDETVHDDTSEQRNGAGKTRMNFKICSVKDAGYNMHIPYDFLDAKF